MLDKQRDILEKLYRSMDHGEVKVALGALLDAIVPLKYCKSEVDEARRARDEAGRQLSRIYLAYQTLLQGWMASHNNSLCGQPPCCVFSDIPAVKIADDILHPGNNDLV